MSSAYKAKWCSEFPMVILEMLSCDLTAIAKGMIAKINSKGDRGSPCLHPLFIFIVFEILLLVKICAYGYL